MTEAKQLKVLVEPVFEVFDCNERGTEPIAFYCKGHINSDDFLRTEAIQDYLREKNEDRDLDIEPTVLTLESTQVKHSYWRVGKDDENESDCNCEMFLECSLDEPNAFAVTVIDLD